MIPTFRPDILHLEHHTTDLDLELGERDQTVEAMNLHTWRKDDVSSRYSRIYR